MCIEQLAEISKALLTPVIAIVTTYIAWQQWTTNQQKLNLDCYDRRLKVYGEVKQILSIINQDSKASYDDLLKFHKAVSEADFLFESEIPGYINEIYERGVKLQSWFEEYRDNTQPKPDGYDHEKITKGINAERTWLTNQLEPAKQKFKKHLNINH